MDFKIYNTTPIIKRNIPIPAINARNHAVAELSIKNSPFLLFLLLYLFSTFDFSYLINILQKLIIFGRLYLNLDVMWTIGVFTDNANEKDYIALRADYFSAAGVHA
jgi:hypothetical protein